MRTGLRWPILIFCLLAASSLAGCAGGAPGLSGRSVECAPYAREVTGLQLYGPAASWWDEAAGRYRRTASPAPGRVLVFAQSGRLPYGHVSVVRQVRSAREITVTQANWVHQFVAQNEPVVDVSPGNDWSLVRVWWAPVGQMGRTAYPTLGFVGPD